MSAERRGSLTTHWGLALAAAGMSGYIGVAAFLNGGSDRPGGVVFTVVAICAAAALLRVRTARPDAVAKTILGIGLLQAIAAIVMLIAHWGAPPVIAAVNGILLVAWTIPGVAF